MEYITPLLFATAVLADYYIDNTNTSVVYAMSASQSGQPWETFSVGTKSLALSISNSTGNYTIPLDASHCYDQNYALGDCGTTDNCFVQIPFTGSGITVYVFNAGTTGMTASFSVDSGNAVSNTIQAPPPPSYQVSNVSLYNIQGLQTGIHTIKMTLLDWNGVATSMKFDYAHVNETFVASPATTSSRSSATSTPTSSTTSTSASQTSSQVPTQTSAGNSAGSQGVNIGSIIGATLGGLALCAVFVIGFFHLRKRKTTPQVDLTPESTFQVNPFPPEFSNPTLPSLPKTDQGSFSSQHLEGRPSIAPLVRSDILRDALASGSFPSSGAGQDQSSKSPGSRQSSAVVPPSHQQRLYSGEIDADAVHRDARPSALHAVDGYSPLSGSEMASRYNLTAEQVEVIDQLRVDQVPLDTIARVIEGFVSTNLSGRPETSDRKLTREKSYASVAPPPSYQSDG